MDKKIRQKQQEILDIFSNNTKTFALAGGTALELYYLHHRFSADLDFFSPKYAVSEIERLVAVFKKSTASSIKMESEFTAPNRAQIRFYSVPIKGYKRQLKIDFIEDVLFTKPTIKKFKGIPVYSAENIYLQKIAAIAGTELIEDEIGRQITQGRMASRDVFDLYMLSTRIKPLHIFLRQLPDRLQRGMVHWYRSFSRQDLRFALLDLDIYDKDFDSHQMIIYLDDEIKKFIGEVLYE